MPSVLLTSACTYMNVYICIYKSIDIPILHAEREKEREREREREREKEEGSERGKEYIYRYIQISIYINICTYLFIFPRYTYTHFVSPSHAGTYSIEEGSSVACTSCPFAYSSADTGRGNDCFDTASCCQVYLHIGPMYRGYRLWRKGIQPQHTASHCNTLQQTATHCITLQHAATLCSTLQHPATHCNTLQHTATHCSTLQHPAAPCSTLQHTATPCSALQHPAVPRNTLQHTATHCNTLQHTATHCTPPGMPGAKTARTGRSQMQYQ